MTGWARCSPACLDLTSADLGDFMPRGEMIADKRVLFVMAVEAEYGPHLRARFDPLMIGVGPVEAALNTGLALQRLDQDGALPDLVVSLGSAGSRTCTLGEVYQEIG